MVLRARRPQLPLHTGLLQSRRALSRPLSPADAVERACVETLWPLYGSCQ
jgi:hypothetical protein